MVRLSKPTPAPKAASYLRPWNWTKCAHHKGMEPRILPPTLFSLHLPSHSLTNPLPRHTATVDRKPRNIHFWHSWNRWCKLQTIVPYKFQLFVNSGITLCLLLFVCFWSWCGFVFPCMRFQKCGAAEPKKWKQRGKSKKNLVRQEIISYFTIFNEILKTNAFFSSGGSAEPHSVWCFSFRLWLWALLLGNSALKKWNQHGKFKNSVQRVWNLALFRKIFQNFENQCGFFEQ